MSTTWPEASVLIPCYNGRHCIGKCLETLTRTNGPDFEVIVVDNASIDGSLEVVRAFPQVKVIANKKNQGFPHAINQAAKLARGEFLIVLNQDTEVDPNWLVELTLELKQDRAVGVCGPKIVDATDRTRIQQVGVLVDRFGFGVYLQNLKNGNEVFMVSGAAMAIKRSVFDSIGMFDPDYFLFEEDLDLCWRVNLAGFKVVVNPRSLVYHVGGSSMEGGFPERGQFVSTEERRYFSERNTLQTLLKNYQLKSIVRFVIPYVGMNIAEIGLFAVKGRLQGVTAYIKSLLYNLSNFRRIWEKHLEVERLRRIPDGKLSRLQTSRNLRIEAFMRWGIPSFRLARRSRGE